MKTRITIAIALVLFCSCLEAGGRTRPKPRPAPKQPRPASVEPVPIEEPKLIRVEPAEPSEAQFTYHYENRFDLLDGSHHHDKESLTTTAKYWDELRSGKYPGPPTFIRPDRRQSKEGTWFREFVRPYGWLHVEFDGVPEV
jgi:hypothetical protein